MAQPPPSPRPHEHGARVPIEALLDLARLSRDGQPPSQREIRAALPRGWVLEPDGRHARRDLRLFFREAWVLLLGLLCFGLAGSYFLWSVLPRGWAGALRLLGLLALLLVAGGLVAPLVTRALYRRRA